MTVHFESDRLFAQCGALCVWLEYTRGLELNPKILSQDSRLESPCMSFTTRLLQEFLTTCKKVRQTIIVKEALRHENHGCADMSVDRSTNVDTVPTSLTNLVRYAAFVDTNDEHVDGKDSSRGTAGASSHSREHSAAEEHGQSKPKDSIHIDIHSKIIDGFDPGVLEYWQKVMPHVNGGFYVFCLASSLICTC